MLGTLLWATSLSGQTAAGDSAWAAGDLVTARLAYERELGQNPRTVRALYRLGILAAWNGKLDSALSLLRSAREVEPGEPDVRLQEATVFAWDSRFGESLARYDSLVLEYPERHDMAMGRAQTLAWAGRLRQADAAYSQLVKQDPNDLDAVAGQAQVAGWAGDHARAVLLYRRALQRDPDHLASLIGLAQIRQWQGRPEEARLSARRALELAPNNRAARQVDLAIRALSRPQLELSVGWSRDSDKNTLWWQNLSSSILLGPGLRGFASAGIAEASDPVRDGTRLSGELGASYSVGNLGLTGAVGARRLASDGFDDRSLGTWRGSLSYRFAPTAGAGVGYAHYSFDETALLLGRDLDVDELSADADAELTTSLSVGAGAGIGWLSDGNRRTSGILALTHRFTPRITGGLFGRALSYRDPGVGYFAPNRFLLGEVRGAYTYGVRRWEGRLSGGLGLQQIGESASSQGEWHLEARLARRWSVNNEVTLSGGASNSAASSTTGAFRYYTAMFSLRVGL